MKSEMRKMNNKFQTIHETVEKVLTNSNTLLENCWKSESYQLGQAEYKIVLENIRKELEEQKQEKDAFKRKYDLDQEMIEVCFPKGLLM